jgi:hypothetical protein
MMTTTSRLSKLQRRILTAARGAWRTRREIATTLDQWEGMHTAKGYRPDARPRSTFLASVRRLIARGLLDETDGRVRTSQAGRELLSRGGETDD